MSDVAKKQLCLFYISFVIWFSYFGLCFVADNEHKDSLYSKLTAKRSDKKRLFSLY